MLGEMHLIAFSCDAQTGLGEDASGCTRIWFLVEYRYHQVGPKEMHQTAPVAELRRESQEQTRPSQEGPREVRSQEVVMIPLHIF